MSFQSFITQQVAALTDRLNAIATNAKKIDELPPQQYIDPSSKIHVSRNGISERIELGQLISQIEDSSFDEIIAVGNPLIVFNTLTNINEAVVPEVPTPTWRINNIYYSKNSVTKREVPFASSGLNRYDVLLLNTSNDIIIQRGDETAGIAIIPSKPINTIVLSEIYVTDNSVGDPSTPVNLSKKLDRGGYIGTAQTLADAIDAIFVPDQLISAVPPTRSGNIFTYPALGYSALLSKTLRTNVAHFITTITAASTTNHKRVDLIYFKPDNTLAKIVGTEDLIIAPRPDVPAGSVGVSFINVFGNVIDTPTPITNEISIQNFFGVEIFKITDYMRFQNVSFDVAAKAIIIDPLVPLSVFIDPVNGNDTTAVLQNSNKPFKTINALLNSLPTSVGETYSIYITGGNVDFSRRISARNLRFIAYSGATLDFSNMKENDGVTDAYYVFNQNTYGTWTFENSNISLKCDFNGIRKFTLSNGQQVLTFRGTIQNLNMNSYGGVMGEWNVPSLDLWGNNDFEILNCYQATLETTVFRVTLGINNVIIQNYYFSKGEQSRLVSNDLGQITITINNIIQQGNVDDIVLSIVGTGIINRINLKNVVLQKKVILVPFSYVLFFDNVVTDDKTFFRLQKCSIISGSLTGVSFPYCDYVNNDMTFRNYTGLLRALDCFEGGGRVYFENCNLTTTDYLVGRGYNSTVENLVFFKGFNSINQIDTSKNLFKTFGIGTAEIKPILITLDSLTTNATTYGVNTSYVKSQSTFKEKLNEIVIRNKTDLINRELSSSTTYVIDADIMLLSDEYIQVPAGGLTIDGYGFDTSKISKNVSGQSIFASPVGGSGNFVSNKIAFYPGLGSVFNLVDSNGTHALELNDINFQGVAGSSLGMWSGYRQFTGTTCGFYGLSDGITLEGNWSGFKLTNSNIIGFGASGTLFKKGVSTLFSNRFYIDLNLQIATGSKICDFSESNLVNNESLQVINCYNKVNGIVDDATTSVTFPNITPYSPKAYFSGNKGIKNSNIIPYGINAEKLLTYTDDTAAASGGIVAVGDTYIESSTGYFKKRLT